KVQRFAKRLADRRRSVLFLRRVLWLLYVPAAVRRGPGDVVEARRGRHPGLLHAREIGEQLEGRTGLVERDARVVIVALHLVRVRVVVIRADVRENLAGGRIHRDQRGVVHVAALQRVDVILHFLLGEL